jgi:hypothetical protein
VSFTATQRREKREGTYEVGEEESRGGGKLSREEGDGASRVLSDGGDSLDETRGEGDDEEPVDDLEEEVAGHERELDAGTEGDSLETGEDCEGGSHKLGNRERERRRPYA